MALAFVAGQGDTLADNTTGDVSLPATESGDWVVLATASDENSAVLNSLGWSSIYGTGAGTVDADIWTKKMTSTPGDTVANFTSGSTRGFASAAQAFRGGDTTDIVAQITSEATGATGMPDAPTITGVTAGNWVLIVGFLDDDQASGVAAPTDYDNLLSQIGPGSAGLDATVMMASNDTPNTTSEDPGAFTATAGDDAWKAISIELAAAAGGGGGAANSYYYRASL